MKKALLLLTTAIIMMAFQTNAYAQIPVTDFSASSTSGCGILSVNFTDLTINTPTSWNWDFGDLTTHSTIKNPTHVYTNSGTYTVTLIASNSFGVDTMIKSGYINLAAIPTITFTPAAPVICMGQSISLTVNGGTTYTWSPGGLSGSPITVSPATTTTYTVTGTSGGCTSSASVTVTVNPDPTVTANATSPSLCNGACTNLNAGGATTYMWIPGSLSGSTVNVCPTTTTAYTVTGTSTGGCTASSMVTVTVNPNPTPTVTVTPATCGLNNGTATVNPGGMTYFWSNCAATQTISNLPPATYTVTVSNGGCSATATGTVTTTGNLTLTVTATNASCSTCNDGTAMVNVTSGTPPYNYNWSNGANIQSISNCSPGIYTVTVVDGNGCLGSATAIIGIGNCAANFNLIPDSVIQHLYYAINLSSGVPPLHYLWNWGDGTTDSIAYPNHTYVVAGIYNICVTISDSVGCSSTFCDSSNIAKSGNTVITVMVIDPATVGVQEINNNLNLQLFPNPFSTSGTLLLSSPVQNASLTVYDMLGKEIKHIPNLTGKEIIIQRDNMKAGMYFFRIEDKSGVIGKGKFVVE